MITTEEFWQQLLQDAQELDERYIEVPDPDNIGKTILIHKGFEDFLDYDSASINTK